MKKFLLIAIVALVATSCSKEGASRPQPTEKQSYYFQVEEVSNDGQHYWSDTKVITVK